jgi:hypothetical protein
VVTEQDASAALRSAEQDASAQCGAQSKTPRRGSEVVEHLFETT